MLTYYLEEAQQTLQKQQVIYWISYPSTALVSEEQISLTGHVLGLFMGNKCNELLLMWTVFGWSCNEVGGGDEGLQSSCSWQVKQGSINCLVLRL